MPIARTSDPGSQVDRVTDSASTMRTLIERVILAGLIVAFVVLAMIPAWRHLNSDFRNYYLVARLYREGYPLERVYEWVWFQRQWDHIAHEHGLVNYQPLTLLSALVVEPLSSLSPLAAKRCWLMLNIGFVLLTAKLLVRCTDLGWTRVLLLIFLAFLPLRSNFLYGQMHLLLLLLLTLAYLLHLKEQYFWSGIVLAIAAALKIYPALFLVWLAIKRRWTAAGGIAIGIAASLLLSISLFGMDACRTYAEQVLPWAMRSQTIDPYSVAWGSLNALLARLFIAEPELNPSPVAHLPWMYALLYAFATSVIVVVFLWATRFWGRDRDRENLEWVGFLFLLLLLSSQPAPYHFVALILPSVVVVDYLLRQHQRTFAGIFTIVYILVCACRIRLGSGEPTGWVVPLYFPRLFLMLLYGGLLVKLSIGFEQARFRLLSRRSLAAAVAFLVLFAVGLPANLRRFRGQFDNYASRVVTVAGSAIATDPLVGSGGLFFTGLVAGQPLFPNAYAVYGSRVGLISPFAASGDWFHPAVVNEHGWAEVASVTGSRIVRFSPVAPLPSATEAALEVEDGEQPTVSGDGEQLAFIREVRGRNSLWIHKLNSPASPDYQIAGPDYDAREATFFPDHRVVFSSRRDGKFRLYVATLSSGAIEKMNKPSCSARYPVISPDGKSMAFACEERGYSHLRSMNLSTEDEISLTDGECNSINPTWTLDSKSIIYATDCGRGLGITALAKLSVLQ